MDTVLRKAKRIWGKWEAIILLIGIPASLLVWAYSNFATVVQLADARAEIGEARTEMRVYVDQRHAEVSRTLHDIKEELGKQRALQERILLRVNR